MKSNYVTYTSSLPTIVMEELAEYAAKSNKKKNEIIAEALAIFLKEQRANELAESFKKLKNDPEQQFLAEAGLGDFQRMIEEYENS